MRVSPIPENEPDVSGCNARHRGQEQEQVWREPCSRLLSEKIIRKETAQQPYRSQKVDTAPDVFGSLSPQGYRITNNRCIGQ
jgi:hypothetical protein